MVGFVSWRDIDSRSLQVIVDDRTQYRSRMRHNHECFACQVLRTDRFKRGETVVTRQDHNKRLLHEKTERQVWHRSFLSKKSGIELSFRKSLRKWRGILTRYHHVNVRQLVAQDPQGFGHPGQFVSGQKAHREAGLGGMNGPACSFGPRVNLQ